MSDTIKIFKNKESGQILFLRISYDFKYYKVTPRLDRFGDLVTHVERMKKVLMASSSLNNIHATWRTNGWKKAEKDLMEDGYVFIKDMPTCFAFLTQQIEHKNLQRFLNNEPLQPLENIHPFKVGQVLGKKGKALYKIIATHYDYVIIEHITLQIKNRRGQVKNFSEQMDARQLMKLIGNKHVTLMEMEGA